MDRVVLDQNDFIFAVDCFTGDSYDIIESVRLDRGGDWLVHAQWVAGCLALAAKGVFYSSNDEKFARVWIELALNTDDFSWPLSVVIGVKRVFQHHGDMLKFNFIDVNFPKLAGR